MLTASAISGWVGGVVGCGAGYPFDTVKTLMQCDPHTYPTATQTARKVIAGRGLPGFFRGCVVPLLGVGAIFSVCFVSYDAAHAGLQQFRQRTSTAASQETEAQALQRIATDAFLCGAFSGLCISALEGPAELIKIRQQATLRAPHRTTDAALSNVIRRIYRENNRRGLRNFTTGLPATLARDVPGTAIWFAVYEVVRRLVCLNPDSPTLAESLLAGGSAGVAMWSLMIPVDVAKTMQQSSLAGRYGTAPRLTEIMRLQMQQKGIRGFYAGFAPIIVRAFVANAAAFGGRDVTQRLLQPQETVFLTPDLA